jgi:predicted PurR-regulated permease PerM
MIRTDSSDLTRTTLAVLFICILIAACFWVLRPFLSSLLWAAMIVIATWPYFLKLQTRLWGKRWLAILVMIVLLALVLIVPVCFAVLTILDRSDEIVGWFQSLSTATIPPPPGWLERIPFVGSSAAEHWQNLAAVSPGQLSKLLGPYASKLVSWFVGQAGNFTMLVLHFLLSIAIAVVLYTSGEKTAGGIRKFARRLAGQSGDEVVVLSAKAIRGVALGIVVTALVQSLLGGIGLYFAGVPAASLLTALMLMLCIAQIGPGLVLIPAAVWLFYSGHNMTGSLFAVWAVLVCAINNFLQPVLIRKGVDLPMVLIITGVIGGLISFGIIGLFIGPVILAVTFTLLRAWISRGEEFVAPIAAKAPQPAVVE